MIFDRCWLVLAVVCCSYSTRAQTKYHHNVFWGRIILADNITERLRTELWIQKRTQDTESGTGLFSANQYDSYWLWFTYNISQNFKVSLSPLGYFETYALYTTPADLDRPPVKEFRYTLRLEQEQKFRWINFGNRYSLEYRTRDLSNSGNLEPNWRIRYMARLEMPIRAEWLNGKSLSLIAYDELMVQFGEAVKGNANVFDQNRIYLGLSYQLSRNIRIAPAYLFTILQRPAGDVFDHVDTFWVVLTFDKVVSQFTKRERG